MKKLLVAIAILVSMIAGPVSYGAVLPTDLGMFTLLETFDSVTSSDGYTVSFSFRGVSGNLLTLFIVASPESGYGGYAVIEVTKSVIDIPASLVGKFHFQSHRYVIKYIGEQVINVTKTIVEEP